MAHEFESGFVVGEQAWHGLATLLQDPPNTVAEAIVEAGLNWEVESIPVYDGDSKRIEGWQALRRSSDRSILHVATDSYDILQNKEAFKFFDAFLQDGSAALESMGSLREGRTVFGCARIGDSVSIGTSSDETAPYLVLHTSHDGVLATGVMFTPVRTVCSNTLAAGISQATAVRKVRHSARQRDRLESITQGIDIARRAFDARVPEWRRMAQTSISADSFSQYVRAVFRPEKVLREASEQLEAARASLATMDAIGGSDDTRAEQLRLLEDAKAKLGKAPRGMETMTRLFEEGQGSDMAGRTVWGAYNAATAYIDSYRGRDAASSYSASLFGVGAGFRDRAHNAALALLN